MYWPELLGQGEGLLAVNMCCAAFVMTWHQGVEGSYSGLVRGLHAAECGSLENAGVFGVTHSRVALYADVHALFD